MKLPIVLSFACAVVFVFAAWWTSNLWYLVLTALCVVFGVCFFVKRKTYLDDK